MKKTGFLFLLALIALQVSAQRMFFDAGIKAGFGPTVLFNTDIFDSGDYRHLPTFGPAFGGKLGVNFNGHHALTFDVMRQLSKQELEFEFPGSNTENTNTVSWNHTDLILLYRYSGYGAYIEIGPKLSRVGKVTHDLSTESAERNATEFYEKSYMSGVFGFGSYFAGSDLVTFQIGIRLAFSWQDMVAEDGKPVELNYPTPGFPNRLNNAKTLATAAMINLELNYAFGRFAKTECTGRKKFILFE